MARCFYIIFNFLFIACSSGNPARHLISGKEWRESVPLIAEESESIEPMTHLHYSLKENLGNDSLIELSYSFVIISGDSAVWEEGIIRMP